MCILVLRKFLSSCKKQQVSGTVIITKCAPTYAYIYGWGRDWILKTSRRKPLVWFRYVDDVFFIWTHDKEHLETLLQELNSFKPDLKYNYESNEKEISFLDLNVTLNEGKITTDLYNKSTDTDRHQYLHFKSSHPYHPMRSIVYSQGLRDKRICSEKEDFLKHRRKMKLCFPVKLS